MLCLPKRYAQTDIPKHNLLRSMQLKVDKQLTGCRCWTEIHIQKSMEGWKIMMIPPTNEGPSIDGTVCKWCERLIKDHSAAELTKCIAKEINPQ